MAKSKLDKIIKILISICLVVCMYLGVVGILWFRDINLPYTIDGYVNRDMVLKSLYDDYVSLNATYNKRANRRFLANDLGVHLYFYTEANLRKYNGLCYGAIRLIVIDKDLSGMQYCVTLTHEMMHLKKMSKKESYICFETFKYLYESEDMHNVGVWYAIKQLEGAYSGEYNVSNQIVDYLTNN